MEDCIEFDGTEEMLALHISKTMINGYGVLKVEPYLFDKRIGWDTYIVTLDGNAIGFTNGPLTR